MPSKKLSYGRATQITNPFANKENILPETGALNMTNAQLDAFAKASGFDGANTRGSTTSQISSVNTNAYRPAGDSFSKADPINTTQNQTAGDVATATEYKISEADAITLDTSPQDLSRFKATSYGVDSNKSVGQVDASAIYNQETDKGSEYYSNWNASEKEATIDQGFLESSLDTKVPEIGEIDQGYLSDKDLLGTIELDDPNYAKFGEKIGEFDSSMKGGVIPNQTMGRKPQSFDLGQPSLSDMSPDLSTPMAQMQKFSTNSPVGGEGFFKGLAGKAGGALGKAGDFMKGPGGQGLMAGLNVLSEMGAVSARNKAIGDIDNSLNKLSSAMDEAITNKEAGYAAAQDAFQQGKGLVGKRLSDGMKGAFAGVRRSNIATGSREKVKKDIRGQVSNQADMAIAGLETTMAEAEGRALSSSRSDRSQAKSAYAEAKRKQDELEQSNKMAPFKMAANVIGVVNPAVGMAMNAGLSLYDAYG